MEQPGFDFKKLRAQISLLYGIELDETSIAILSILKLELTRQFVKMDKAHNQMIGQIQQSKKALQVDAVHPRWQAFWHGMGQWGLGLCLAVISALVIISFDWSNERKEKQQLQLRLAWYKEHYEATQKASLKAEPDIIKKNLKQKNK